MSGSIAPEICNLDSLTTLVLADWKGLSSNIPQCLTFISADEFLSVPEFAVNPLSQRLLKVFDGLNFKEFLASLSAFSSRASLQQKIEFIFKVYDADNNGKVTFNDMLDVLRDLTGQFISEQQREQVLTHVLEESGYTKDSSLTISDFVKILGNSALKMEVEVPVD